jgi:hypothetical protein
VLYVDGALQRARQRSSTPSHDKTRHQSLLLGMPNSAGRRELANAFAAQAAAKTINDKGKALESLTRALFALEPALRVKQTRRRLGDEEIDFIVVNDCPSAFWSSLRSPLLIVECKNWTSRVGAREVRDLDSKVRNHRAFVRLGFLIAANGYTSEAREAIKRLSRDDAAIILIALSEIEDFMRRKQRLTDWFEDLIAALI